MPPKLHFAADAATAIRLRRNAALGQACSFEKRAASRALAPLLVASLAPYRITVLGSRQRYACMIAGRASPAAKLSCATPTRIERSEKRRVGKEGVSKCRSRWSRDHYKKK